MSRMLQLQRLLAKKQDPNTHLPYLCSLAQVTTREIENTILLSGILSLFPERGRYRTSQLQDYRVQEYNLPSSLSLKCNVLRESFSVDSQSIPCATLKRRGSWVIISKYLWVPPSRPHRVATAAFWRTFHHDGKMSPLSLYLPSRIKLQCTLQLRGQIHSHYFISTTMSEVDPHPPPPRPPHLTPRSQMASLENNISILFQVKTLGRLCLNGF